MITATVVPVNARLPKEYETVPIIYIYGNGNSGNGIGYYKHEDKEWEIEYSDDHPNSGDITHWIDIKWDSNMRVDNIKLRKSINK